MQISHQRHICSCTKKFTSQSHSKGFSDTDDFLKAMLHLHRDLALTDVSCFLHNLILNRAKVCI